MRTKRFAAAKTVPLLALAALIVVAALLAGSIVGSDQASAVSAREICRSACRASYDACRAAGAGIFNKGPCRRERNACWDACNRLPG